MKESNKRKKTVNRRKRMGINAAAFLLGLCFLTSALAGCGGQTDGDGHTFKIVTSFYPLYIMAMNLTDGIDGVEIANMAEPQTGCLHDYQLRPGDLIRLDGADVFIANGGGMESFLSGVTEIYPSLTTIYALDGVDSDSLLPGQVHGHDHDHDEDPKVLSAGDYDVGEINPHTWLNPDLYKEELQYLSDQLGKLDKEHKDAYEKNRTIYEEKIDELMAKYEDLKTKKNKPGCVLLHESFAYLADNWGFSVLASVDVEKDSGFSAKEIRDLTDKVGKAGGGIIISDSQYSGRISSLLAEETGKPAYQLDSCVSGEYDGDAWLSGMEKNLEELKNASE